MNSNIIEIIRQTKCNIYISFMEPRIDNGCKYICQITQQHSDGDISEYDEANARLIITSVNNHSKLIEALKKLQKIAAETTSNYIGFDGADELDNCIDEGKKLLQSIEQETK